MDKHRVHNPGSQPFYANVGGTNYEIMPEQSVEVDARTALILGEYRQVKINRDVVEKDLARLSAESRALATGQPAVEPVVSPWARHGEDTARTPSELSPDGSFVSSTGATRTGDEPPPTGSPQTARAAGSTVGIDLSSLRGQALDDALTEAGLSRSGTVADKQARLAAHLAEAINAEQPADEPAQTTATPMTETPSAEAIEHFTSGVSAEAEANTAASTGDPVDPGARTTTE